MLAAAAAGNTRVQGRVLQGRSCGSTPERLLNAQFDLAEADFPVVVIIAGDDRVGANLPW
jgi:hypothetical protein